VVCIPILDHRVETVSATKHYYTGKETIKMNSDFFCFFFRLSEFFFYPLLARLDIGAGVEQPFGCLIVQNRQAV